jgi:hypothetical protein
MLDAHPRPAVAGTANIARRRMTVSRPSECLRICMTLCALILTAGFTRAQIKPSLTFLTSTGTGGATLSAADSTCDCGIGRVGMFEFDVQVPRPTEANAIVRYRALFSIARFTIAKIREDTSCPRLVYIDGNVWLPNGATHLRSGLETPSLAPPGRLDLDYVFTGEVTGGAGAYTVVARIESGWSREVVKAASYTLKDPGRGTMIPDLDAAVDALAEQLSPIGAVITQWEKRKRDADPGIARSQPEGTLTIRPAKNQLDEGEVTDVEIELVDCDGVQLKNRTVHFEAGQWETVGRLEGTTGGKMQPSVVVTDDEGKARVKFTAGNQRGPAYIRGWYGHHRPGGQPNAIIGQTTVNIGGDRLSFRTVVDVKIRAEQINHSETHHIESVYAPSAGSGSNCTTTLRAGERCQFAITTLHASATAQWPQGSHTASLSNAGNAVEAELTRGAKGATLRLAGPTFATMSPDEDDEHYIGVCIDQEWKPMQFDLSEEELVHFSTLQKTLSISSPLGVNNCVGSGTLTLTGQL